MQELELIKLGINPLQKIIHKFFKSKTLGAQGPLYLAHDPTFLLKVPKSYRYPPKTPQNVKFDFKG